MHFRQHYNTDVAYCDRCLYVCLCVSHTDVPCKKTAEPIEMPFAGLTRVIPRNHY